MKQSILALDSCMRPTSMPDAESDDTTWGVHSLALLVSATLN